MFAKLSLGAEGHAADITVEIFNFHILGFIELLLRRLVDGNRQVLGRVFLLSRFSLARLLIPIVRARLLCCKFHFHLEGDPHELILLGNYPRVLSKNLRETIFHILVKLLIARPLQGQLMS